MAGIGVEWLDMIVYDKLFLIDLIALKDKSSERLSRKKYFVR